jgi:hypothetical protein
MERRSGRPGSTDKSSSPKESPSLDVGEPLMCNLSSSSSTSAPAPSSPQPDIDMFVMDDFL